MKKVYPFFSSRFFWLLILLCCGNIFIVRGQAASWPFAGKLYGEKLVGGFGHFRKECRNEKQQYIFTATANGVYCYVFEGSHVEIFGGYSKVSNFSVPAGKTIVSTGKKVIKSIDGSNNADSSFIVMLSDSTLYDIRVGCDTFLVYPYGKLQAKCTDSTGTKCYESFEKVTGDGIYVLSSQHLYGTHDNGITWFIDSTGLGSGSNPFNDFAMDTTLRYLYAATNKGLYKQDTVTDLWKPVASYPGSQAFLNGPVFIDRSNRILVADAQSAAGYYLSADSGSSWQVGKAGLNIDNSTRVTGFSDDIYGDLYAITVILSTSYYHIYKLSKDSTNWEVIDTGFYSKAGTYPLTAYSLAGDDILFLNTSAGIFESADLGKTWVPGNNGIPTQSVSGFVKTKTGRYMAGNILGLQYMETKDSVWHQTYPGSGFLNNPPVYQDSTGNLYSLDQYLNPNYTTYPVVKSTDNGNTWLIDSAGLYNIPGCGNNFIVDETGGQHFFSPFPALIESKPVGGSWSVDSAGLHGASSVYALGTDGKGYLYATGRLGGGAIKRRPIGGGTWVVDTAGIAPSFPYFPQMASSGKTVFVYTNINTTGKLFYRGASAWVSIPFPANNTFYGLYVAAVSQDASGYIYAAFYLNVYTGYVPYGVYYTKDHGASWVYAGLNSVASSGSFGFGVKSLISYGDTTYAITEENGIYTFTHSSALPVALSSLKASQIGKGIEVEWSGFNEIDMRNYDVEKSANGNQFIKIGEVTAKGATAGGSKYNLFDAAPFSGDNFYRVKAISKDGTVQYSGIVKVDVTDSKTGLEVFPNPAHGSTINVQLHNIEVGSYVLAVYNTSGQRLYARAINHPGSNAAIGINIVNLPKGIYLVTLRGTKHIYNKTAAVQ